MVDFAKLLDKNCASDKAPIVFTPDQQEAYDAVCSGKNVCITGPAGTGKSVLLNCLREAFKGGLDVTASTGIAALNVSGITIHSWAGLGLGEDPINYIVSQILQRRKVLYRIRNCRRLAIDEVSMLSAPLLTKLSEVLSAEWARAEIEVHELTTIVRQKDANFAALLNKIRVGTVDHEVAALLQSRLEAVDNDLTIKPVVLEGRNEDVDRLNQKELAKIDAEVCRSVAQDTGEPSFVERLKKDCIAPRCSI